MNPLRFLSRRPLVSVIIASYNHAPFVETAVRSVLEQAVAAIEIILVDDGSTDGTAARAASVTDVRLRVITLEHNRRIHPRNLALSLARGRYVAFQNSDDEWAAGKLAAQVDVLEQRPDTVACFTGVETIGVQGEPLTDSWATGLFTTVNRDRLAWLRHFFDEGNGLCLPSAVVRRSAIAKAGEFLPSLIQLSDYDLWVRLAALGEFHILREPMTRMRIVPGSNVSRPIPETARRTMVELSYVLGRFARPPVCRDIPAVFANLIGDTVLAPTARLAWLARHAWTLGTPAHQHFADRLMAGLLDDPAARREIIGVFGTEIVHEFNHQRGQLELGRAPA